MSQNRLMTRNLIIVGNHFRRELIKKHLATSESRVLGFEDSVMGIQVETIWIAGFPDGMVSRAYREKIYDCMEILRCRIKPGFVNGFYFFSDSDRETYAYLEHEFGVK